MSQLLPETQRLTEPREPQPQLLRDYRLEAENGEKADIHGTAGTENSS
jgi:hypothetical protein